MKITGNTMLITGGGSGIGRGLAEQFHALGNQVIIAGRRRQLLEETAAQNAGMRFIALDVGDADSIAAAAAKLAKEYPALNVLVNNAGIMRQENLHAQPSDLADAEATVRTNLLGPIRLTAALLGQLRRQPYSAVMNVSSGLAFVPLVYTPTYCATKAAIHSYTQSLRYQLKGTSTEVLELIPPYVATELSNWARRPAGDAAGPVHCRGDGDSEEPAGGDRDLRGEREAAAAGRRERKLRRGVQRNERGNGGEFRDGIERRGSPGRSIVPTFAKGRGMCATLGQRWFRPKGH